MNPVFQQMPVSLGVKTAREVALADRTAVGAKAAKNVEFQRNEIASVPGQPLNTLATLGGPEFVEKYQIGGAQ